MAIHSNRKNTPKCEKTEQKRFVATADCFNQSKEALAMKESVQHYNNAYIFKEDTPAGTELTISCHGEFAFRNNVFVSKVALIGDRFRDASDLASWIGRVPVQNINSVHLAFCHSADFYQGSIAAQLSRSIQNTRVVGYAGSVTTGFPQEDATNLFLRHGRGTEYNRDLNRYFRVFEREETGTLDVQYHKIEFLNGRVTSQTNQIITEPSRIYNTNS